MTREQKIQALSKMQEMLRNTTPYTGLCWVISRVAARGKFRDELVASLPPRTHYGPGGGLWDTSMSWSFPIGTEEGNQMRIDWLEEQKSKL